MIWISHDYKSITFLAYIIKGSCSNGGMLLLLALVISKDLMQLQCRHKTHKTLLVPSSCKAFLPLLFASMQNHTYLRIELLKCWTTSLIPFSISKSVSFHFWMKLISQNYKRNYTCQRSAYLQISRASIINKFDS